MPFAFVTVFFLGVVTAVSFARTGLLVAPITTHAVYNLIALARELV